MTFLSLVIPIFNEEESLPHLRARLDGLMRELEPAMRVEVICVDDHSSDNTTAYLRQLGQEDPRYRYLRLASNSGSHIAIVAGLGQTRGDCVAIIAADLQDPPELIPQMLARWREGHQVVWAVRAEREGISFAERLTSQTFYRLLNTFSDVKLPPTGADYSLLDRAVVDALLASVSANPSLGLEVARLGFNQTEIPYVKAERRYGRSKWNLRRKLNAFADAFVTTSYMPLRIMSYIGLVASAFGFLYALVIVLLRVVGGIGIEGWSALMVVVLVFGGVQMIMLGVIGEYLWRTLEHSRRRPLYFIEEASPQPADKAEVSPPAVEKSHP